MKRTHTITLTPHNSTAESVLSTDAGTCEGRTLTAGGDGPGPGEVLHPVVHERDEGYDGGQWGTQRRVDGTTGDRGGQLYVCECV